jgi:ABC-type nitrate/sulfonate/bicarbonate transport system permease component
VQVSREAATLGGDKGLFRPHLLTRLKPQRDFSMPRFVTPLLRTVVILGLWELFARTVFSGRLILPPPDAILRGLWADRHLYGGAITTTGEEALLGFAWGNLVAIVAAILFVQLPMVEKLAMRAAVASYCLPGIAIAPILQIVLSGNSPKVALAILSVFFTTLITFLAGLRSPDPQVLELVKVYGGGSFSQLRLVRLRSSLPHLVRSLQLAAPAAVLGAIIGEFLGGTQGLGVMLMEAQADLNVVRTWGIMVVCGAIGAIGYLLIGIAGRPFSRWSSGGDLMSGVLAASDSPSGGRSQGLSGRHTVHTLAYFVISSALILGIWDGILRLLRLNPYFAKNPADVWDFLFVGPSAGPNRSVLLSALWTTLRDAGFGFVLGGGLACLIAAIVVLIPRLEREIMPWAITLRAIPLVAIAPLLSLVFGRGIVAAMAVCALVSFFPTLVLVVGGLRSAAPSSIDLVTALGGGKWTVMWKVRMPSALPSLFASARIAAPSALLGAIVTEWTVTGNGLGYVMIIASETSAFAQLWAACVVITVVSLLLYSLIGACARQVAYRYV